MTLDSGLALAVCTWVTRGDERGQLSGEKWVLQALVFGSVTSAPPRPPSLPDTVQGHSILMGLPFFPSWDEPPGCSSQGMLGARRCPGWTSDGRSHGSGGNVNKRDGRHVWLGLGHHCSQCLFITLTAT